MPSLPFNPRASLLAFLALAGLAAATPQAHAADLTGNATLTTDYVWRGSTQTSGDLAMQAGFRLAGENGLYASVWGSSVRFAPGSGASSEFDFTVGWGKALSDDWTVDANVLRYQYPSTASDLNWTELNGTVTWKGNYWVSLGHSNEALGYDASGTHAQIGVRFPVNDAFRIEAAVAHYVLDDAVVTRDGYTHGSVSAVWAFKTQAPNRSVELRVTAHATDSAAKAIFGDDTTGTRIEAALQANF